MSLKLYYSYYWLSVCDKDGNKSAIKPVFKDRLDNASKGRKAVIRPCLCYNVHLRALKSINRALIEANKKALDNIADHGILNK